MEPIHTYLVTAYRWGWSNGHNYIVYCGTSYRDAEDSAEKECDDRGGKYGVQVSEWCGEEHIADHGYYSSLYGEKHLTRNWKLDYINSLGHMMGEYVNGYVSEKTDDNRLAYVSIQPDPRIVSRVNQYKEQYEKLQEMTDDV